MQTNPRNLSRFIGWLCRFAGGYAVTMPVVLLGCLAAFYNRLDALAVLPVLAAGWGVIVALAVLVAKRAYLTTLLCLMVYMIAGHWLTAEMLLERRDTLDSISYGSDDDYYINIAQQGREQVRASPWAVGDHWENVREEKRGSVHASLRGYPLALTYLFAWLPDDYDQHYTAAVSLNLVLLCLLFLAVFYAVGRICGTVDPVLLGGCFAALCLNLFLEASQCRKDIMLNLLVFTACVCAVPWVQVRGKIRARPAVILALLSCVLLTFRPVYLILPVAMLGLLHIGQLRRLPVRYFVFSGLAAVAVFYYFYRSGFELRGINLLRWDYGSNQTVLNSGGMAARVYALPLIGPFVYYLLLPFPLFQGLNASINDLVKNLAFFAVLAGCLCIAFQWGVIWRERILRSIAILAAVFIFMTDIGATLLDDADPRYKAIILPLLCVLAYGGMVLRRRKKVDINAETGDS